MSEPDPNPPQAGEAERPAADRVREELEHYGAPLIDALHLELTERQSALACNAPGTNKDWVLRARRSWLELYRSVRRRPE